jgi:hypothetical protein
MFLVARTESNEPNKRVIMCQILKTESLYILIFVYTLSTFYIPRPSTFLTDSI